MTNSSKVSAHPEHFVSNLSNEVAIYLFKKSIRHIEFAISSYCNRRCIYCPNNVVDRHSEHIKMNDNLFYNILSQLKSIDYSGKITVHRYNEPLSDVSYALLRLVKIRSYLPNAKIHLFTNGDYLDTELLYTLRDIGVNVIIATIHYDNANIKFDDLKILLLNKVNKLSVDVNYVEQECSFHAVANFGDMILNYQVIDFLNKKENGAIYGFDRGGYLNNDGFMRTERCIYPFSSMHIEYDGTLLPCCNIHPDLELHKQYILGKLDARSNIFEEWANKNYAHFRKMAFECIDKLPLCKHCEM